MTYQQEVFPGYTAQEATDHVSEIMPAKMIYLVIIKRSPTWYVTRTIRAKRLILKSSLRRVAAEFYKLPELNITVL